MEQLQGYLIAIVFKKSFDSLNHNLLITALEHCGFGNDFIKWIKMILKNQELCKINGCHTAKHFRLERGGRQIDPISAYVFVIALEILFIFIKLTKKLMEQIFSVMNTYILLMLTTQPFF